MIYDFPYDIPVGTQVVINEAIMNEAEKIAHPKGAVGVVIKVMDMAKYRVRFLDGYEVILHRSQLTIRKHYQHQGLHTQAEAVDYRRYIIYQCVTGSRAYGLDHEASDVDRRGIYLPPASLHWSLYGVPDQIEDRDTEECYWELQKFIMLALKANPNILECLYTPWVEKAAPLAQELLAQRNMFLSQLVYQTYNGYVMSQFRKMHKHWELHGRIKWKHAMHLIRLLLSGITVLRDGFVPVHVDTYREDLLAIRQGERPWEEVNRWRIALHQEFDAALTSTSLPARPDYEMANAFLIKARHSMVEK